MKRSNGTGSITKLSGPRRRPWMVRIPGRNERGRPVQVPLGYYARQAEAQAALDAYNQHAKTTGSPMQICTATVGDVFNLWSDREYRKLRPASISSHNAAWNMRVSRFADRRISTVTLDEWQSILDEGEDEGRSQSSINNDAILIRSLCKYAAMRDIIAKDYSCYLEVPTVDIKRPRNALSDLQLKQLSNLAKAGVPWADTALILCYTGFRVSEFLELTRFSYHPEEGGYLQGGKKTEAGKNRIVPVHPAIRPYLMRWLEKGGDAIICHEDGSPFSSTEYRDHFTKLMEQIGAAGATPHWCRHTFASRLHAAGVDDRTTRRLLGHSVKVDVTDRYIHVSVSTLREAILRLTA